MDDLRISIGDMCPSTEFFKRDAGLSLQTKSDQNYL